jgi:hypothetical protein
MQKTIFSLGVHNALRGFGIMLGATQHRSTLINVDLVLDQRQWIGELVNKQVVA